MLPIRRAYPSDVSDEEWLLVARYLTLMPEDAPQRQHSLRELFNGLRYVLRYGIAWRAMPNDLPPGSPSINRGSAGWRQACSRRLRRICAPSCASPRGATRSRPRRSSTAAPCARRQKAGRAPAMTGPSEKRGSKLHIAVDTLGHLLALHVTPGNVDDRAEVGKLAAAVQEATGESVELIYVDQGYTGDNAAEAAKAQGAELCVVKLAEAKKGFVLLPKRWVVERSFAWATRCRRLVKDYERHAETLAGFHILAFACIMLKRAAEVMIQSA